MGAPGEGCRALRRSHGIGLDEREQFGAEAVRAVLVGAAEERAVEHSVGRECPQ
ncbi:hypothetical protein ABZ499_24105 [Streptomyces sp. NPDC019990]|uniref:hypothetical protein n=1 Tax=Streptomyces sp. NPDC019990 TaxID=3154693 RepID=UPI0033C5EBF7